MPDVRGRLMLAFHGTTPAAEIERRLATAPAAGHHPVPLRERRHARPGPRAGRRQPGRGRHPRPGGRARCSSPATRRAASSWRWATARHRSRATWPSARPATRSWQSAWARDRARARRDGHQRRLRARVRPRDEPGQPAPRHPLVRRRPGDRRLVRRGHGPRTARRRGRGRRQALPGARRGGRRQPPRAAGDRRRPRPPRRGRARPVRGRHRRGRRARHVGAHRRSRRSPAIRHCPRPWPARSCTTSSATSWASRGLTITDALDMAALPQGTGQVVDAIAAVRAGQDLLLCSPDPVRLARIEDSIVQAAARRLFDPASLRASSGRLAALRRRLAGGPPPRPVGRPVRRAPRRSPARPPSDRSRSCGTTTACSRCALRPAHGSSP